MRSQLHRSIPWRQTNGSLMPGAFAGQLCVLGSNVAGLTTWNSVVLVGQKTSSRKISKKDLLHQFMFHYPYTRAWRHDIAAITFHLGFSLWRQKKVLVHPNTSASMITLKMINQSLKVLQNYSLKLTRGLFINDMSTKKWISLETAMHVFSQKIHQLQNKKQHWISKEIPPYYIIKSSQFPLPGCLPSNNINHRMADKKV